MGRKLSIVQVIVGTVCLLACIPFVCKPPPSFSSASPNGGVTLSPSLPLPSQTEGFRRVPAGEESWRGVIDEGIQAAVRDSDEKAKAGLVQPVQLSGGVKPLETPGPHRKLLDGAEPEGIWHWQGFFRGGQQELFECNRSSPLTDVCILKGDVRVNLTSGEIVLYARSPQTPRGEEKIRPHPRKWNWGVMEASVAEFTLKSVDATTPPMPCLKRNTAPGVLFSAGGYCGGVFHDFNEVYLPLFETTHVSGGDVVMLVSDLKGDWWWHGAPGRSFIGAMTRHPIKIVGTQFDAENYVQGVECFDQLTVGLYQHTCMYDELGGAESRLEATSDLRDFASYLRRGLKIPDPAGGSKVLVPEGGAPVIGIAQRLATRKLKNFIELLKVAKGEGFKVVPIYFEHYSAEEVVRIMATLDVFVAVHGAGLSNMCLMRPGGVVMQIMPYGEGAGGNVVGAEYRNFAKAMDAEYLEWSVPVHDSSIKDQYNKTDDVVTSPERVWKYRGQDAMNIYHKQDVTMPEDMFRAYLHQIRRSLSLRARIAHES